MHKQTCSFETCQPQDEEVYKRNVDQPTLEDHVDKQLLPKVMQVKKFGFAGRTKYTHLKDQDTTQVWPRGNPSPPLAHS